MTYVAVAIVCDLLEHLPVVDVLRVLEGHEERDHGLVVGPPQLHVPLQMSGAET